MADLTYRPYQDRDIPGFLALWEASGWGTLDEETWRQWFLTTPHGPALVIAALDGGAVVGQMVFAPSLVDADGGPYRAARVAAPILHPSVRKGSPRSPKHPVIRMFLNGIEVARDAGWDVIYSQPDRAWLPAFRVGVLGEHFTTIPVGCAACELGDGGGDATGWRVVEAEVFTDAHESLWAAALDTFPVVGGVRRTPPWLRYRLGQHDVFEAREGGVLRAWAAVRRADGLIMDAVAGGEEALSQALSTIARELADVPGLPYSSLKAMRIAAWEKALANAGFKNDPYTFVLAVCPLSDRFPAAAADPAAWYAVPSD